jgi:hypothetical protein
MNGAVVFDLSFIPHSTTISSATLTVSVNGAQGLGNLEVFSYTAPSSVITLSNFPVGTNLVGTFTPPSGAIGSLNAVTTFNVTGLIQSLLASSNSYQGFLLEANVTDGGYNPPGNTTRSRCRSRRHPFWSCPNRPARS